MTVLTIEAPAIAPTLPPVEDPFGPVEPLPWPRYSPAPAPDAARAYATLDFIVKHRDLWNQAEWLWKSECGTRACFAGWTSLMAGDEPEASLLARNRYSLTEIRTTDGRLMPVGDRAQELLRITDREAHRLFSGGNRLADLINGVHAIFGPRPALAHSGAAVDNA